MDAPNNQPTKPEQTRMRYRRALVPGGTWFFTLVTAERSRIFETDDNIAILRNAFRSVRKKHPFTIDAIVVLPDHIHCILTLPENDTDFPKRIRLIKSSYTKHCRLRPPVTNPSRRAKDEQMIWQHRYWEHLIRDETDYLRHVDYIHYNPVKHCYVNDPASWPWSSIHRFIRLGLSPQNWGACTPDLPDGIGFE